ncbi:MAG: DUF2460 domain-containing protein [bacterium]|nr:DUF2460 domain-containing protein [bacterium]
MTIPVFPSGVLYERAPYKENWKTLSNQSEGGVEQRIGKWTRPIRQFEVIANMMEQSAEADILLNFIHARKGAFEPFIFITRSKRTWEKVFVGTGTGSRRVWVLPFLEWDFLTLYVGGVEVFWGPDYDVLSAAGPGGSDLVVFRVSVANTAVIEADGGNAKFVAYVKATDNYEDDHVRYGRFNARLSLTEVKSTVDPYDP